MEKIISEVADRLNKCSVCGHPHRIAHLHRIPSDTKLSQYPCHLKFNEYIGSFLDGDFLIDVYAFPVHYKQYVLETVDRAKKELKKTKTDLEQYVEELYEVEEEEDE